MRRVKKYRVEGVVIQSHSCECPYCEGFDQALDNEAYYTRAVNPATAAIEVLNEFNELAPGLLVHTWESEPKVTLVED